MKNNYKLILPFLVFSFWCNSSFAQVKSDYDKNMDFSPYTTYSFDGWQKNSDEQLSEFDKKRIIDALKSELGKRGMTYTPTNADAHIALYIVLLRKTSTTAYTEYTGGLGYHPRWGWGRGTGMHSFETTYDEKDYIEGTFVVDLYDSKADKLIWQGVLTGTVNENSKKREKRIQRSINKLMRKFPKPKVK